MCDRKSSRRHGKRESSSRSSESGSRSADGGAPEVPIVIPDGKECAAGGSHLNPGHLQRSPDGGSAPTLQAGAAFLWETLSPPPDKWSPVGAAAAALLSKMFM